jgi:hypothetical protein
MSGKRRLLKEKDVVAWLRKKENFKYKLGRRDYLRCLYFAIKSYYSKRPKSNFGTTELRDAGKMIFNYVEGKLGEIAVTKFLKDKFDINTKLDFELRDAIVGQDITEIAKPRSRGRVYNPPRLNIAIKASKMKSAWLIVSRKEAREKHRKSDIYIFVRVDLYLNHFLRIMKQNKPLSRCKKLIPDFISIDSEICGFCNNSRLIAGRAVKKLPHTNTNITQSYIVKTGSLKNTIKNWENLIRRL